MEFTYQDYLCVENCGDLPCCMYGRYGCYWGEHPADLRTEGEDLEFYFPPVYGGDQGGGKECSGKAQEKEDKIKSIRAQIKIVKDKLDEVSKAHEQGRLKDRKIHNLKLKLKSQRIIKAKYDDLFQAKQAYLLSKLKLSTLPAKTMDLKEDTERFFKLLNNTSLNQTETEEISTESRHRLKYQNLVRNCEELLNSSHLLQNLEVRFKILQAIYKSDDT
ncbi:unnamed protein product [Moneuplotes crassus]|uniref:Uncharacterized protein n=1 Tax=Euplotes crassus TaxID=5936 RepID=A0AAD1XKN3_EUPCR|nr:unnamed protein product [Moneuplotes crassus]